MDINNYTNELLLDFLDVFHREMAAQLEYEYQDEWLEKGVKKHFKSEYFARIEEMLNSPMRAVDMPHAPEELYGVEHLSNIVLGNWDIFERTFENRERTSVYLSEIAELRHNLAHRRKHHLVRVEDVVRFAQNGHRLLQALGAREAFRFSSVVDSLTQNARPWGVPLGGSLPPLDEIYDEFIGRPEQLRNLGNWFMSDARPIVIWGYGGAGKSALAYKFAREIQESSSASIDAVVWLTAKRSEFVEGVTREHAPDFEDVPSFCRRVWEALYDEVPERIEDSEQEQQLIQELNETKCLLIIDDLDTLLNDVDTAYFLLYALRNCKSKIIYTSRQQIAGLKYIEVPGFVGPELEDFVRQRALEYKVDAENCLKRLTAISSVTDGYPLFVDDLIRHSILVGIDTALSDWSQRKGDAAREYALSRQLEQLQKEGAGGDVLIAVAVSNRALSVAEIGQLAGVTDQDAESGIKTLLSWQLLYQSVREEDSIPVFTMNANTRRLTLSTFKSHPRLNGMKDAFATLSGERIPQAKRRAIAVAISEAKVVLQSSGVDDAAASLTHRMTGELAESPDLHGTLGWIYSQSDESTEKARECFELAHRLGTKKVDPYFHWIEMEKKIAEQEVGKVLERDLLALWEMAAQVAELAIERCGEVDVLCQQAGYLRARQAGTYDRVNEFARAQGAYRTSVEWFEKALSAPSQAGERVSRYHVYRGLAISYAGLNDTAGLVRSINRWRTLARDEMAFLDEVRRIVWKLPEVELQLPWLYGQTDYS